MMLLLFTPMIHGIQATFKTFDLNFLLFTQNKSIEKIEIDSFNMMNMVKKEDIPYREIDSNKPNEVVVVPKNTEKQKRIYIYSTHQKEAYKDDATVIEASYYLKELLINKGYEVIVEERNFPKELSDLGYDYSQSYLISRSAIKDAIKKYQGFDLIIDFHRDSLPRESTYIKDNEKSYAKMMIVLGGLSPYFDEIYKNASILTNHANQLTNGIMKKILVRESYYNQDISENMILIEVGSENNYYQEVKNSLDVLSTVIDERLK